MHTHFSRTQYRNMEEASPNFGSVNMACLPLSRVYEEIQKIEFNEFHYQEQVITVIHTTVKVENSCCINKCANVSC